MPTISKFVQITALIVTWVILFLLLTFFTELILAPWDTAIHQPPLGSWQRTFNDFVDFSLGKFILSLPLLALSLITVMRSRSTPLWHFIAGNVVFLVALVGLFMAAAFINNTVLFPYPPVLYDPNYRGYHRSVFPLAVMLSACAVWYTWQRRHA